MAFSGLQRLTLEASAKNFDATAREVDKLGGATEKVTDRTNAQTKATTAQSEAQEKLNATESDFVSLLTQIHPALGAFVDAGIKASKIAGDFATQNIDVNKSMATAKDLVVENAGALKLLGAGGAALAGVYALSSAWEQVKKEEQAALDALRAYVAEQSKIQRDTRDRQAAIEGLSDTRREGGFNAAQSAAAVASANRVGDRFAQLDPSAINQAAALLPDASEADIADAAFLIQSGKLSLNAALPSARRSSQFRSARGRNAGAISGFRDREAQQLREVVSGAQREASGSGGVGTVDIEEFIASLPGDVAKGYDPERLAQIVASLPQLRGGKAALLSGQRVIDELRAQDLNPDYPDRIFEAGYISQELGLSGVTVDEVNAAKFVRQQLDKPRRDQTVNVTQNNGRYIGPSAQTQRAVSQNGTAIARDAERRVAPLPN